MGFVNQLKVK